MYIKYKLFVESLDEFKDTNWFLDKLGAVKMDITEYMGVTKEQRKFELDEFIDIKNVTMFLDKFDVKFGEIFDSREIYTPLDTVLVWVFMLPKDQDQTADPEYVLYKEKNKLIRLAMVTKDDYNVYQPLNKNSGEVNEKYQAEVNHFVKLKKEIEDILYKGDDMPIHDLNSSRKKLVYGFKELIDAYTKKDIGITLKSGEKAIVNYDDITITNLSGKTRKYSWGELDSIIIREIGTLILNEL